MTHDYIVRGLAYDGEIRAYAATTTESVQEAKQDTIHGQLLQQQWDVR